MPAGAAGARNSTVVKDERKRRKQRELEMGNNNNEPSAAGLSLNGSNSDVEASPSPPENNQAMLDEVGELMDAAALETSAQLTIRRATSLIPTPNGWVLWKQEAIYFWYQAPKVQFFVAGLIFANFIVSALAAQIIPNIESKSKYPTREKIFSTFDAAFAWVFTVELVINMWGSFWWFFWKSGWNIFDFVIVGISLLAMYVPKLPGITVLRLFRAFRVFRLFKRVPELKKIIEGVLNSLPGVGNAFIVLGLLMGIWSIMGVEFFSPHEYSTSNENFGNFFKAMLSLFQIMTFDSWSSGIAWDICMKYPLASVYFVSYVFLAGIVMANVVVAILLNKFLEASENFEKAEAERKEEEERMAAIARGENPAPRASITAAHNQEHSNCGTPRKHTDREASPEGPNYRERGGRNSDVPIVEANIGQMDELRLLLTRQDTQLAEIRNQLRILLGSSPETLIRRASDGSRTPTRKSGGPPSDPAAITINNYYSESGNKAPYQDQRYQPAIRVPDETPFPL